MKLAPIQLKRYFITHINITALNHFDNNQPHAYNFKDLQNKVIVTESKKQPGIFQVSLTLSHSPQPKENLPYAYSLQVMGFFAVHPKLPKLNIEELIRVNGPAVLYGIAREILAQVTGRGPWGAIMLPTVNFLPEKSVKKIYRKDE